MVSSLVRTALFALGVSSLSTKGFLPSQRSVDNAPPGLSPRSLDVEVFDEFLEALKVMQDAYFQPWLGTWPGAIDWTAAVMGTHVSGALRSLSNGLKAMAASRIDDYKAKENLITTYFSQVLSFYFGQDAFSLRNQAYDDILWVVLGWLETIQFINLHTTLFYSSDLGEISSDSQGLSDILHNQTWHGNLWIPTFAHRARIFWDIANDGWETKLCGGGLTWNPRLTPYKNAITNELFISASASMYLYFPGDDNTSPFNNPRDPRVMDPEISGPSQPRDKKHLEMAVAGYDWLQGVGMMNPEGLYIDGFHIKNWDNVTHPGFKCDAPSTMVYTYNQGVVLTGQLGLWKATGDEAYLYDGHMLIQSVIKASGWNFMNDKPADNLDDLKPGQLPPWHGLGRAGILEEVCDVSGECSQNSQTFKGIFFHHMTAFCVPLDKAHDLGTRDMADSTFRRIEKAHDSACRAYIAWVRHNAMAALSTRDAKGKFGMWWTPGILPDLTTESVLPNMFVPPSDPNSVDYRTYGIPNDDTWVPRRAHAVLPDQERVGKQVPLSRRAGRTPLAEPHGSKAEMVGSARDPNTRGRGRTVETQGGGLAVLRALWEISNL